MYYSANMLYLFERIKMKNFTGCIYLLLSLVVLSGCNKISPEEQLAKAHQEYNVKNYSASIIQLKNLIRDEPENIDARLLMANSQYQLGNFLNAEKEYVKAIELGVNNDKIAHFYTNALYALDDNIGVTQYWEQVSPHLNLENKTKLAPVVSLAYLSQGKGQESFDVAKLGKERAIELGLADLIKINTAVANSFNQPSDINRTIKELSEACGSYPERWIVCNLHANALFSEKKYSEAATVFEKILKEKPNHTLLVVKLADSYVRAEDTEKAELYVNALLKQYPSQPYLNLLAATLELWKANYQSALNYINITLNSGFTSPQAKLIASIVHYHLGNNEQSMSLLRGLKAEFPNTPLLTKLYIAIQLRLGNTDSIPEAYSDATASTENSEIFALASLELLKGGNKSNSTKLLNQIDTSLIENQQILNTVSLVKLFTGDSSGIEDLENALTHLFENNASTQETSKVKILLISSLLATDNVQKAEDYVNSWIVREPINIANKLLLIKLEQRKLSPTISKIESIYNSILSLDKYNPTANLYFTKKNTDLERFSAAEKYINTAIENHPNNSLVAKHYYIVQEHLIGKEKALIKLSTLYKGYSADFEMRLTLAQVYLMIGEAEKVIELLASEQVPSQIDSAKVNLMLAEAYITEKQYKDAISIYKNLITKSSQDHRIIKQLAITFEKSNNIPEAVATFEQLQLEIPNNTQIGLILANFYILNNQPELSIKYIDTLTIEQQNHSTVTGLKGKAYFLLKQCTNALPLLNESYQKTKNGKLVPYIFDCNMKSDNKIQAKQIMEKHLEEQPDETFNRIYYANALHKDDKPSAISQYEQVLAKDKANVIALNNIAWLLYEDGKLIKAKEYIDKAIKVSPDNLEVQDTLYKITQALNK